MRFVISAVLIVFYVFVILLASKGSPNIAMLIGEIVGGAIFFPAIVAGIFCIPKSGRTNKRFFLVFNIVIILLIIGQAGKVAETLVAAGKPPKTIVSSNKKIEIIVPALWNNLKPTNENNFLNLKDDSGHLTIIVNHDTKSHNNYNLNDYAQAAGNIYKNNLPDFASISEVKNCESTKLECAYQILTTSSGKKGTTVIAASLIGSEGYYNFFAITNPGLYEMYKDKIFSSLKTLNETKK